MQKKQGAMAMGQQMNAMMAAHAETTAEDEFWRLNQDQNNEGERGRVTDDQLPR